MSAASPAIVKSSIHLVAGRMGSAFVGYDVQRGARRQTESRHLLRFAGQQQARKAVPAEGVVGDTETDDSSFAFGSRGLA